MKDNKEMPDNELTELFALRAAAVAARVSRAANMADAERIAAAETSAGNAATVHAACGIAETGTCVVETDDEQTRLNTMLPETSIIILEASRIVRSLPDLADYLRERQKDGKISYTSLITGPSRTADIERVGAIGVHGPLSVHVILVEN